ncbi:MAG: ribonuclease Z [Candidatus Thermoplasmatota archaeon]|nr:ribonuclease Z [Candidatus Thermoplasmatota archaeon]
MELVFIGTGGSWPSKDRNVSCVALRLGKEIILFDCGEGTQRQLMRSTISFMKISKIFISHFHGDHFLGIPGLVQSMTLNNRKEDLEIYGPKGSGKLVRTLLRLGYFTPSFEVRVYDLNGNDNIEFEENRIRTCYADHNVPTLAYALEEYDRPGRFRIERAKALGLPQGPLYRRLQSGKSIVFKGKRIKPEDVLGKPRKGRKLVYANDTRPCENVVKLAENCDVLIHDATVHSKLEEKANKYAHSSARQAAMIAKRANAKLLFLIHFSPRYKETDILEKEARKIFKNSICARDFMTYNIKAK